MKAQLLCLTRDEENNCAYAVFYVKPNGSTYTFFTDKVKLVPKVATPPPVVDSSSSSSEVVDSSETEDSSSVVDSSVTSESGMTFKVPKTVALVICDGTAGGGRTFEEKTRLKHKEKFAFKADFFHKKKKNV